MGRASCRVSVRWARESDLAFGADIAEPTRTLQLERSGSIHVSHVSWGRWNIADEKNSAKMKTTYPLSSNPDTDTRLLLAWSIQCTGSTLRLLQSWATSRGDEIYRDLIDDFCHQCGLAELALIHVAMLALLRLRYSQAKRAEPSGPDSFLQFRQMLDEIDRASPQAQAQAQAVLEDMAWAFNDSLLLTRSSGPKSIHDCYSVFHSQTKP